MTFSTNEIAGKKNAVFLDCDWLAVPGPSFLFVKTAVLGRKNHKN